LFSPKKKEKGLEPGPEHLHLQLNKKTEIGSKLFCTLETKRLSSRRTRNKLQKTGLALPFGHSLEASLTLK
jgi:hypothetical protein